jgi:hypothetical protein
VCARTRVCVCVCVCVGNHFYCACVYGACVYGWHCILIIIIRIIVRLPFNVNCIYKRPLYCILCTRAYVHVPGKKKRKKHVYMYTCILIRLTTLLPLNSVHVYYSLYFVYVLLPLYSAHVYYSPCSQCMCACTHISILNPQNISGGLLLTVIVL